MKLTLRDVQKVAKLSRLKLAEDEQVRYVEQLGQILNFIMKKLKRLDKLIWTRT